MDEVQIKEFTEVGKALENARKSFAKDISEAKRSGDNDKFKTLLKMYEQLGDIGHEVSHIGFLVRVHRGEIE